MNILKTFRKPYFAMFLSSLMLFISCEQYNTELNDVKQSFDYETFNTYKSSNHLGNIINKMNSSSKKNSKVYYQR
jgi:hypothetical protein